MGAILGMSVFVHTIKGKASEGSLCDFMCITIILIVIKELFINLRERESVRSGGTREGGMELIEMQYLFKKSKRNKKGDFKSHVIVFEHRGRDK